MMRSISRLSVATDAHVCRGLWPIGEIEDAGSAMCQGDEGHATNLEWQWLCPLAAVSFFAAEELDEGPMRPAGAVDAMRLVNEFADVEDDAIAVGQDRIEIRHRKIAAVFVLGHRFVEVVINTERMIRVSGFVFLIIDL